MADRYLYFMLPGLIGAALLRGARRGRAASRARGGAPPASPRSLLVAALCAFFAVRSVERAAVWRSAASLVADAAAHYPEGVSANLLRAKRAAQIGDVDGVVAALRAAAAARLQPLRADRRRSRLRRRCASSREFRAVVSEIAAGWIARGRAREHPTQQELQMIAHAHFARGEKAEAIAVLRRALALGGPRDAQIRADLAALGAGPELSCRPRPRAAQSRTLPAEAAAVDARARAPAARSKARTEAGAGHHPHAADRRPDGARRDPGDEPARPRRERDARCGGHRECEQGEAPQQIERRCGRRRARARARSGRARAMTAASIDAIGCRRTSSGAPSAAAASAGTPASASRRGQCDEASRAGRRAQVVALREQQRLGRGCSRRAGARRSGGRRRGFPTASARARGGRAARAPARRR